VYLNIIVFVGSNGEVVDELRKLRSQSITPKQWAAMQKGEAGDMEELKRWLLSQRRSFQLRARTTQAVYNRLAAYGTPFEDDGRGGYVGVSFEQGDYSGSERASNILYAIIPTPPADMVMPTKAGKPVRVDILPNDRVMFSLNAFVLDLLSEGYKWGENEPGRVSWPWLVAERF
jgi:hypothetical protein